MCDFNGENSGLVNQEDPQGEGLIIAFLMNIYLVY